MFINRRHRKEKGRNNDYKVFKAILVLCHYLRVSTNSTVEHYRRQLVGWKVTNVCY